MVAIGALTAGPAGAASRATGTPSAGRSGTALVRETFTGTEAPGFTGFKNACLTGAPAAVPPPADHPLGGCLEHEVGPVPPLAAAPHGYLLLTDAGHNHDAAALFNHPIPATEGLDVTFDVWQYGSTTPANPADGVSFFLTDGEYPLKAPGAFGGSLGYAKKQHFEDGAPGPLLDGVAGGYLGVGLDVLGNYFADTEQRGYSCEHQPSPAGTPGIDANFYDRGPNMVTVRGPGNGFTGYCYITATTDFPHTAPPPPRRPWPSNLPGDLQGPFERFTEPVTPESAEADLVPSQRRVNIVLTPAPNPQLIVSVDFSPGSGAGFQQVLDVPAPTPVPPTYKFGFAASTGHFTDVHLVRFLAVDTDRPLPKLDLVKQIREPRPGNLTLGDRVHYEFVVTNSGDAPITNLVVHDPKVGPVTCPVRELDPGHIVTCHATYIVAAPDVALGHIANTARASGVFDGKEVHSPPSSERVELVEPPGLAIEKRVVTPGPHHEGQTVHYSYTVVNTGGIKLTNVHINDDRVTGITCEATTLAPAGRPGDSTTCHGTYVITHANAVNGVVTNTAVAVGDADGRRVASPPATESLLIGPPRLSITKTPVTPAPHFLGSVVRYRYLVTNTGPVTLHSVVIMDSHVAAITCDTTTLAPGQSTACRGRYRIRVPDVLAGHVANFAQASGIDHLGTIFKSPFVTARIPVTKGVPVTG